MEATSKLVRPFWPQDASRYGTKRLPSWSATPFCPFPTFPKKNPYLPFLLLSDPELTAIQAYGVWQEKKLYGKVSMGVVRTTFVINEKGLLECILPKVKPDTNAEEILSYLDSTPS